MSKITKGQIWRQSRSDEFVSDVHLWESPPNRKSRGEIVSKSRSLKPPSINYRVDAVHKEVHKYIQGRLKLLFKIHSISVGRIVTPLDIRTWPHQGEAWSSREQRWEKQWLKPCSEEKRRGRWKIKVEKWSKFTSRPQESLYRKGRVRPSDRGCLNKESWGSFLRFLNNSLPALSPKNQKCLKNIVDGEQGYSLEKSKTLRREEVDLDVKSVVIFITYQYTYLDQTWSVMYISHLGLGLFR